MSGDTFLLFVYGTLKRGGVRHHLVKDQTFLGEARTLPRYVLFDMTDHPALVHRPADGRSVQGELYRVETNLLAKLDQEEGAPTLFRLEPIALEGEQESASAYFFQKSVEGRPLCAEDRWLNA
jgi:gamma-glutamylcyclotransferase (GGCT)/AIG2-like uncharacterized protein YtfP